MLLPVVFLLISITSICQSATLQRYYEPRIVNGKDVKESEIPYQISLQLRNNSLHFCGGSIINDYYVITAAHCVASQVSKEIVIVAGIVNLDIPHLEREVESIISHEYYNPYDSYINDIALIKVKTPFIRSSHIGFIKLPAQDETIETGAIARVSGFGKLTVRKICEQPNGPTSKILQQATIFIANQKYCKGMYESISMDIYDSQICANDPSARRGSCESDSGGPLIVNGKLVGLVSWSKGCSLTDFPTVYTRVPSHVNWIRKHAV